VESDFNLLVWVVGIVGIIIALLMLAGTSKTWDEFGKGRLVMDRDLRGAGGGGGAAAGSAAALAERDEEIRQMLEAQNLRRARRGEPEVDIEAELQRLTTPVIDDDLRSEIRDLVLARNARRARAGKPPLDVDAEIEREIAGLDGLMAR
jgi:hypothetical protein